MVAGTIGCTTPLGRNDGRMVSRSELECLMGCTSTGYDFEPGLGRVEIQMDRIENGRVAESRRVAWLKAPGHVRIYEFLGDERRIRVYAKAAACEFGSEVTLTSPGLRVDWHLTPAILRRGERVPLGAYLVLNDAGRDGSDVPRPGTPEFESCVRKCKSGVVWYARVAHP